MERAPKKRALWTERTLQYALDSVRDGMSVLAASKLYKIPRRTLRNHIATGSRKKKLGSKSVLTPKQEKELCGRIFRLGEIGMPLTDKVLRRTVFTFAEQNNLSHRFNTDSQMAGRKWMKLFFRRHPDVAKRKAQSLNPARAQKVNRYIVADYFSKLKDVLLQRNLMNEPQRIYNIDEKGCRLTIHHQQQVLARKGVKRVHLVAPEHAENVTIVACGNALGQAIPPMVLFKGKRKKDEWQDTMPPGTKIEMTDKGSMTTDTFIKWLNHFGKYKTDGEVLLIFDGATSHLDANIVDAAEKHQVILLCLPSNTTHELQPLDKSVFRSFEHYWDTELLNYWTMHPDRKLTRTRFGEILSIIFPKAMSSQNLQSGFKATGIYPFNSDILPDEAYAPSMASHRPNPEDNSEDNNNIPSNSNVNTLPYSQHENNRSETITVTTSTPKHFSDTDLQYSDEDGSRNSDEDVPLSKFVKSMRKSPRTSSTSYNDNLPETSGTCSTLHTSSKRTPVTADLSTSDDEEQEKDNPDTSKSLTELLPTPEIKTKSVKRRKALNSVAQVVKKDLFASSCDSRTKGQANETYQNKKKPEKQKESWFCFLCQEDRIADMRMCILCQRYVHEECAGLYKGDKIKFICSNCDV